MAINPNSDRDYIENVDIYDPRNYPAFFNSVKFEVFRHIKNLTVQFTSPITVITGSNKVGKTTILQAIACSHYNFNRRNVANGNLERTTWGNVMKFTPADTQGSDWTYYITHREGNNTLSNRRGQRRKATRKWNGVAKKESQVGAPNPKKRRGVGRAVILIDIERIISAKNLPNSAFLKASRSVHSPLDKTKTNYISYILERSYDVSLMCRISDKELFSYSTDYKYSSYNTASGEDVLTRIINDIVDAPANALVLLEEIEIGLHPKIQRRLMDVIYYEARQNKKQFVITTHSGNILSAVENNSRIFIENNNNAYKAIAGISINAALCKMDSATYPLIDLFVEDKISGKIIAKVTDYIINDRKIGKFNQLINVIVTGDAENTYRIFQAHKTTYENKKVKCGYACVLDGDMAEQRDRNGNLKYPSEDGLFFLYDNKAPERFLVSAYLKSSPHQNLQYHMDSSSNPHCLLNKMVENGLTVNRDGAFELCWSSFIATESGRDFVIGLADFLIGRCQHFSPDL